MTTTARVVVLPQTGTELRVETVELPIQRHNKLWSSNLPRAFVTRSCIKSIAHAKTQWCWVMNLPEWSLRWAVP